MFNKSDIKRNEFQFFGAQAKKDFNGVETITLYHKGKVVDVIKVENIGYEYGEFDKQRGLILILFFLYSHCVYLFKKL